MSGDAPVVALERDARAETTALVTSCSLEIWRGCQRLGGFWRSPATVAEEGAFLAAKWRDGRNTLAVVAEGGRVYLYHLDFHDGLETVAGVPASRCDVSRRATLRLATPRPPVRPPDRAVAPRANASAPGVSSAGGVPPLSPVIEDAAAANDGTCVSVAGDRDVLLVGTSTGHLVQFDWDRCDDGGDGDGDGDASFQASDLERGNDRRGSLETGPSTTLRAGGARAVRSGGKGAGVLSRGDQLAHAGEVSDADFCGAAGVLVAVVGARGGEAAAAILRSDDHALVRATAAAAGVPPRVAERLTPPRWCPGSEGATLARLAPHAGVAAGVVAVGTRRGECLLYRLPRERRASGGESNGADRGDEWMPGSQPVLLRALSLRDWGVAPRSAGRVADARWAPDGAAIAVGHARAGLAAWTPGGCRLMCTLEQGGDEAFGARLSLESVGEADRAADGAAKTPGHAEEGGGALAGASAAGREESGETGTALGVERVAWTSGGRRVFATAPARARATGGESKRNAGRESRAPPARARALQYEFATPSPTRTADLGDGESAASRALTCADGFLVLAGDGTESETEPDADSEGTKALERPHARRVALPSEYVRPHGPPRVVCAREGGADVLAAGARGFALVDLETERWRVFGDVSQEKAFVAVAAAWVGDVVAVAVKAAPREGAGSQARGGKGGWLDWFSRSGDRDADGAESFRPDPNSARGSIDRDSSAYSLRVYPKYHLDASSALLETPLPAAPLAVHAHGPFLLVALAAGPSAPAARGARAAPPEAVLYEVTVTGPPRLGGGARAALRETRRAAIGSATDARAILDVAPVPELSGLSQARSSTPRSTSETHFRDGGVLGGAPPAEDGAPSAPEATFGPNARGRRLGPELALVWRAGGALALVDMRGGARNGRVASLASEGIERFWVVASPAGAPRPPATPPDARWSFWTYGAEGTRAWHVPSCDALPPTLAPAHGAEDPELELDRESYPLRVRLGSRAALAVAGCAQRRVPPARPGAGAARARHAGDGFGFADETPFRSQFAPAATSQPVISCALRHLLCRGEWSAALETARASAGKPHFAHALEWLLFSALDRAAGPATEETDGDRKETRASTGALADAARLIREFPEFTDVVAAVARKTDPVQWPALFAVAGDPEALQARATSAGRLRTASRYLLVVGALKGARASAAAAEELYSAALAAGQYGLVGELTRFLVRPALEAVAADKARRGGTRGGVGGGGALGLLRWFAGDAPSEEETPEPSRTVPRRFEPFAEDAPGTPRGARSVPGARGGAVPLLPALLREALREHATRLASSRDLGNLCALSRETGFDVGCFFLDQSLRVPGGGAARLGDFPAALDLAADSFARHKACGGAASAAWAGAGAFLEQTARAGRAGAEWMLVAATLLRRVDALEEVFSGRAEVRAAWDRGVRACVRAAEARGDARRAAFLEAFREDVCGGAEASPA